MFKPRFVLLFTLVGLIAGCDCLFTDWSQWLSGTERTVGDVTADNPLDPNTPALDSPAAVSEPIRLRLSNPTAYDADCRVTMELIGHEVHFSLRRILTATESLVIGPDKADIIQVEATFLADPTIVAEVQILRMGEDFRPGDIVDVVLKLPPDDAQQDVPSDDQGEDEPPPPPPPPPTGACCLLTGTCIVTTEDECSSEYGGEYQGNDISCDPNPCPQPTGACCLFDGRCIVTTADECAAEYGGDYQGDDTSCDPNPCPPPTGACCSGDGYCEVMTEDECDSYEASYWGDGTTCDPNPCEGACCFSDGTCEVLTDWYCDYMGGSYQGGGTTCEPNNPCPQPATGACCLGDDICDVMTESECIVSQGVYMGDDTVCDPNTCLGACCIGDGMCVEVTADVCATEYEGDYHGDGTSCDPNPCMPLPGNDCYDPLVVELPLELPYQHADTTCGRVSDYMHTCLDPYDQGEDFIGQLIVTDAITVDITIDPNGVTGTGISLFELCQPSAVCIARSRDDTGGVHGVYLQALDPGTYHVMVASTSGTWCMPFTLQIDYTNP